VVKISPEWVTSPEQGELSGRVATYYKQLVKIDTTHHLKILYSSAPVSNLQVANTDVLITKSSHRIL
jgi:hypothetical protein